MYSHHERPQRLYVALAAIVVVVLLWFAWHSATGSAAQAASKTALEATEQVLKFNRQGERTLITVTAIFGISIVFAAVVIPYVAWISSNCPLPRITNSSHQNGRLIPEELYGSPRDPATPADEQPTARFSP